MPLTESYIHLYKGFHGTQAYCHVAIYEHGEDDRRVHRASQEPGYQHHQHGRVCGHGHLARGLAPFRLMPLFGWSISFRAALRLVTRCTRNPSTW